MLRYIVSISATATITLRPPTLYRTVTTMRQITSVKDEKIQAARELNKPVNRLEYCLLEDFQSIEWAINAGVPISHSFVQKAKRPAILEKLNTDNCYEMSHGLMQKVVNSKYVGEVISIAHIGALTKTPTDSKILVLDRLQDQGNIGSITRSSIAFGFNHVVGVKGECDLFSKKAITSSRGHVFHASHTLYDSTDEMIEALKKEQYELVASSLQTDTLLCDLAKSLPKKYALVMGNETNGIGEQMIAAAEHLVKIPIDEKVESLNVSAAASIMLYALG